MENLYHPGKKEFQVERMIFFSDAIFAIAITLLVIDIKVPVLQTSITEQAFLSELLLLLPKFLGFVTSFFIIGLYWAIHHRMFGYVINYNGKLLWLNLVLLFSIVLMPFSTALYSEYSSPRYIMLISPYCIYVSNICFTGFMNLLMWTFIGNPKNKLTEHLPQGDFLEKAKIRSLLLPLTFVFSLAVAIWTNPIIGRFTLFLVPIVMGLVRNKKTT